MRVHPTHSALQLKASEGWVHRSTQTPSSGRLSLLDDPDPAMPLDIPAFAAGFVIAAAVVDFGF